MKKIIVYLLVGVLTFTLISCESINLHQSVERSVKSTTQNKNKEDEVLKSIEDLNSAKKITISKDLMSFSNSYSIYIEGKSFGKITGKYVNTTGDKFTLKDNKGNELSSEKQIKRWGVKLNRLAEVYDKDGNTVGLIGEEKINDLFKTGYNFHFYDKDKNEIGSSKQSALSLLDTFKIYDNNNKLCYEINAEFTMMSDEYTITIHDNSSIPTDQVLYLTAIMNSIKRSEEEKNKE